MQEFEYHILANFADETLFLELIKSHSIDPSSMFGEPQDSLWSCTLGSRLVDVQGEEGGVLRLESVPLGAGPAPLPKP